MNRVDDATEPSDSETCWLDEAGDRWEAEGVDPGRIYEFHFRLSPDLMSGGLVESAESCDPGKQPTTYLEIKRVLVRHLNGKETEMSATRPLVLSRVHRILRGLC